MYVIESKQVLCIVQAFFFGFNENKNLMKTKIKFHFLFIYNQINNYLSNFFVKLDFENTILIIFQETFKITIFIKL